MSTHRTRRWIPLSRSALLLAAALTLTACQTADSDGAGTKAENTAAASASLSGSAEGPSSGSREPGDGGPEGSGSEGAGPSDAQISASAVPDHLLPPDSERTQAMMNAVEDSLGRPVADVKSGTISDHRLRAEQAVDMYADPSMAPMESETCREAVIARVEAFAAVDAQTSSFAGEMPDPGQDPAAVLAPYRVQVITFADADAAKSWMEAHLAVQETAECADEQLLDVGGGPLGSSSAAEEHPWGEGTRYTVETGKMDGFGGVHITSMAVDGNRVVSITDSIEPEADPADAFTSHLKAMDALAEVLGKPLRD